MFSGCSGWKSNMVRTFNDYYYIVCVNDPTLNQCSETILELFESDFLVGYLKISNTFGIKVKPVNKLEIVQNPEYRVPLSRR